MARATLDQAPSCFPIRVDHPSDGRDGKDRVEAAWRRLASAQHSVVTRRELLETGLSPRQIDRRLRRGLLVPFKQGIYTVAGAHPTWEQRALCYVKWAGDDAVLSGVAAAALWGIDGFPKARVEIITSRGAVDPDVKIRRCRLLPSEIRRRSNIPLTSIERTMLDLAANLPKRVEAALDCVLHRRWTALPRLRAYLDVRGARGVRGLSVLKELVDIRDPELAPVESQLESRLAAIIRRADIAFPVTQHVVLDAERFIARLDFAYPELQLGIEADGYEFHSGRLRWKQDLRRHNDLTNLGWRILHFTWHDITRDPDYVLRTIHAALQQPFLSM